jgi:hypothetical protein
MASGKIGRILIFMDIEQQLAESMQEADDVMRNDYTRCQ